MHVFVVVILIELILAYSLLDDFPPLAVEHPFVRCLFHSVSSVLVHLLTVHNFITVTSSSMRLCLVNIVNRLSVFSYGCLLFEGLLHKVARCYTSFYATHFVLHMLHHIICSAEHSTSSKARIEKRVIGEWIFSEH